MADQTNDFVSDSGGSIFKQMQPKKVLPSVIKNERVEYGRPCKINSQVAQGAHKHEGNIFPLIEGDEIVGFVYECSCGEVAKILFEYEQNATRAAS